jgi:hypothetical protein
MFYTIYKTTNLINEKIYVGKHQTKDLDDDYMGSGKHLRHSINKYGVENFKKEILFVFDTEAEMNAKEKEIVNEEFCIRKDTYNLCDGGKGGFSFINRSGANNDNKDKVEIYSKVSEKLSGKKRESSSIWMKKLHADGRIKYDTFTGRKHSDETKEKISARNRETSIGAQNSQFGTMWITNGTENRKIKKTDPIEDGWKKGRVVK